METGAECRRWTGRAGSAEAHGCCTAFIDRAVIAERRSGRDVIDHNRGLVSRGPVVFIEDAALYREAAVVIERAGRRSRGSCRGICRCQRGVESVASERVLKPAVVSALLGSDGLVNERAVSLPSLMGLVAANVAIGATLLTTTVA